MNKQNLCVAFGMLVASVCMAQDELDNLLKGSVADARYLASGYAAPAMKALSYGLNQGWYNTAKPHKTLGVDLTVTVSPVYIPSSDKFYQVDNTQLQNVEVYNYNGAAVATTGKVQVPTLFGPERAPQYRFKANPASTFSGPEGVDFGFVPVPIANLGIGLPLGFDLKIRFVPQVDIGAIDGSFDLLGFGLMHDVKQHIPGIKHLPFDLSVFAGYTKTNLEVGFDDSNPSKKGVLEVSSTTFQALISKKVAVLTFYGGLGYNLGTSKLAIRGNYDLNADGDTSDTGETNPFDLSFDANGFRATAGMRLKLAVITFHGDYTFQKYNSLSVGFGISVR